MNIFVLMNFHMKLRMSNDANLRTVRVLEQKNRTLQEHLELVRGEMAQTQDEFDNYKVRKIGSLFAVLK